ncbi:acid protease [Hypoxylon fragiforme]|uniref:acid protease n=1 Tax=Hypoxylon fragiforme TaxID=63214 RepID=UPI0020C6B7D1|nr:acid protease [Hypoxylon fragiforme]KAI2611558.1 acid protease [Hypoxylon fragiforme]
MMFLKYFISSLGLTSLPVLATPAFLPQVDSRDENDVVHSLSLPGFQFRRVKPMVTTTTTDVVEKKRKVQNHLSLTRVSRGSSAGAGGRSLRSAAALFGQVQRSKGGTGYENVTSVNYYAVEYSVKLIFNGIPMNVIIDSGSADTWVRGSSFTCKRSLNGSVPVEDCGLGPSFCGNFTGEPIPNQHFSIEYGDGEEVQGLLGFMDVELAGVTVPHQEIAIASQGAWHGNNVTSGILGLAYPSLTNAYSGNDLDGPGDESILYSPVFTSMVTNGLVEPYFAIAISRNSSLGSISVGGMPPVDLKNSKYDSTPILVADIIDRASTNYQPSFYTIVPKGFRFGGATVKGGYPFVVDTATSLTYLPPDLAEEVNAQFDPPATYVWYYNAYFTECNAVPPRFGVQIEDTTFWVNPKDMLSQDERDPETGLCQTGIASGGDGPYILGVTFLTNVVVSMNIGSGLVEFWSHQYY